MVDGPSAIVISLIVGFVYMTGNLIQMDLAAQVCPVGIAASVFALLMAASNIGISLSHLIGGVLYQRLSDVVDRSVSFQILVGIGALTTAGCWFCVPWLTRQERTTVEP
jgi:hypothetical protein